MMGVIKIIKFGKNKKSTSNSSQNNNTLNEPADNSSDSLGLLKHNQECIVNKIAGKIEEAGYVSDNLIDIVNDMEEYVELQMSMIEKVVNEISDYSAFTEEVSASTENLKQVSSQTMEAAEAGNVAVENSIKAMNDIEGSVVETMNVINTLGQKALHINNMLNVVKDIASSTNLLSLNASIEAARAGEAGRGFAVVAQEVKKLAQRSMESVEFANNTVNEINENINKTIESINSTIARVKEGSKIAGNTAEAFNTIINAITTNNSISEDISNAIQKQTGNLENIIASTKDMSTTFEKLISVVETASFSTQYTKSSLASLQDVLKGLKDISSKLLEKIETDNSSHSIIKTCLPHKIETYDTAYTFDFIANYILFNIHAGLLTRGSSGEISPALAKSWYLEDDNLTWVFNLRKGALFHNGREITSEDVKYSLERLLDPKIKSPNSWCLQQVEGAEEFQKGIAKEVSGIKILDRYHISIKLIAPYIGFLSILGNCLCAILPREEVEKGRISGCGPYILEEADESHCVLSAFNDYFGGAPYVDKIIVNFSPEDQVKDFLNGENDFIIVDSKDMIERLKDRQDIPRLTGSILATYYAGFNLKSASAFARNKELRQALNMAVNKSKIIDTIFGGLGVESKGPFPPILFEDSELKGYKYDPDAARSILNKYNISEKKLKVLRRAEDNTLSTAMYNKITDCIVEDLKAVGIDCIFEKVPASDYLKHNIIEKCDLFVSRWVADSGDLNDFAETMFDINNMADFTGYDNKIVAEKIKSSKAIVNPNKRIQSYREMQRIISEEAPFIFLLHPQTSIAYRPGLLGIKINPLGLVKYDEIITER